MPGTYLIDITDASLKIAANDDVMAFVRTANPFAHSDLGSLLLTFGKSIANARAYCPSYGSCAYVVLHTDAKRIVAIAYGQRALAFRLDPRWHAAALSDGGVVDASIGDEWVRFDPWDARWRAEGHLRLERWCAQAFADATEASHLPSPLDDRP